MGLTALVVDIRLPIQFSYEVDEESVTLAVRSSSDPLQSSI